MPPKKKKAPQVKMSGKGFKDIMSNIGNFMKPVVEQLGPVLLEKVIKPYVEKKLSGGGFRVSGGGLRLAGQKQCGQGHAKPKRVMRKTLTFG